MSLSKLQILTEAEYDAFAAVHPHASFLSSVYAGRKMVMDGWEVVYVGIRQDGVLAAAALLASVRLHGKYRCFYAPRGFLLDYEDEALLCAMCEEVKAYAKKHHALYVKIDPYVPYQQRDKNGSIVEGGFCHHQMLSVLERCGYRHQGFTYGYDYVNQCRWISVLDLRGKTEEELLKTFDQQTRWTIHKTMKLGIRVNEIDEQELLRFKQITEHTARRRGFEDRDLMYYQKMMKAYGKEHLKIVLAQLDVRDYHERLVRQQQEKSEELRQVEALLAEVAKSKKFNKKRNVLLDELRQLEKKLAEAKQLEAESEDGVLTLAGAMFLLYGNEVLYLSSGAYDQYMHLNAAYAIQWQMIRTALALGYAFYNFYGISGYFEKGQEGYGVFDFKRGFQAEVVELPGDFIAAVHPLLYKGYTLLQKLKGKMKRG